MKRGEIWTAAGGPDYGGKPRPVVIVQDDRFVDTRSVTVCALTSLAVEAPLARLAVAPSAANGLHFPSHLMVDKLTTIPRSKLGRRLGRLADEDMVQLDRAMAIFLGLAS